MSLSASISPAELAEVISITPAPHLLDVRNPEEHEYVSLPGAVLIPLHELPERWTEIQTWQQEPVVVYCHHGIRSQHAIHFLRSAGFAQLTNLTGGIDRWSVEVNPALPRY